MREVIWKLAFGLALYVVLVFGLFDGLIHWWAAVASPLSDSAVYGLWFVFTSAYVFVAWRLLRRRDRS
jgi:hypothetical protein